MKWLASGIVLAAVLSAGLLFSPYWPRLEGGGQKRTHNMSDQSQRIEKTDAQWRAELTPEQYRIMRQKGTERAFTGEYCRHAQGRHLRLRRLRSAPFRQRGEVRVGHRLAELLRAGRQGQGRFRHRRRLRHAANRNPVQPLRRPSRPCLRRWAGSDGSALLRQLGVAEARRARQEVTSVDFHIASVRPNLPASTRFRSPIMR